MALYIAKVRKRIDLWHANVVFPEYFWRIIAFWLLLWGQNRFENMRKLILFLLAGGLVLGMASCKEEKKSEDIITRIPHKKPVKKGTQKMSEFTYETKIKAFGESLTLSIHRFADTSLPQVEDGGAHKYYDNKVNVVIKRADGSVFVDKTFTKTDFSAFTDNEYGRKGALLGVMFDTVKGDELRFMASVGSPDPTSDEFIPINVMIDSKGNVSYRQASSIESSSEEQAQGTAKADENSEEGV